MVTPQTLAVALSVISLVVSVAAFVWNVYRELALRPRIRVSVALAHVGQPGEQMVKRYALSGVNFGPGKVRVAMVWFKHAPLLGYITRTWSHGVLLPDYTLPGTTRLPVALEVGDSIDYYLRWNADLFLRSAPTHVGFRDTFGRHHWAPRKQVMKVISAWKADFDNHQSGG
jgi:hypothetical protein